jgi:hypothetical protein
MMPKGVEHLNIAKTVNPSATVKIPMMPKGVEHGTGTYITIGGVSEDSNDAERRWAPSRNRKRMLNLLLVKIPMMPKGVEHWKLLRAANTILCCEDSNDAERRWAHVTTVFLVAVKDVKIPMMPKGVEHRACCQQALLPWQVKIPMMPKGVEHWTAAAFLAAVAGHKREDSNDAERRWALSFDSAFVSCPGVKIPMMPKGVEHKIRDESKIITAKWRFQWCRKALSTAGPHDVYRGRPLVKIPMMPKGVEHLFSVVDDLFFARVKIPMMPKGVEHIHAGMPFIPSTFVKIPMMPKGVEHQWQARRRARACRWRFQWCRKALSTNHRRHCFSAAIREDSNDAERRWALLVFLNTVSDDKVKIPMMPKGVEHLGDYYCNTGLYSEDSNDAERRWALEHIAAIEAVKGESGWFILQRLIVESFEQEGYLPFFAFDLNGCC